MTVSFDLRRQGLVAAADPDESARVTLWGWQKPVSLVLCVLLVAALAYRPLDTLTWLNISATLIYFAVIIFRFFAIYRGEQRPGILVNVSADEVHVSDEDQLPIYTILCPLYHEADLVEPVLRGFVNLDYPAAKLDIRLLLEEDDVETLVAAGREQARLRRPESVSIVIVPEGTPKTKPRACNCGLLGARGDYLVIYDAEDQPEPDQLRKALAAFRWLPERTVCVQSKLNYHNADQNLLTRFFTAEYSRWFDLFLPGLSAVGAPIPLGGTSNHFKTAALRELGGWDPFNVTEDADLGIRIARRGLATSIIDSTTWEEANPRVGNWIRQRSRWVKGYMQTWLVAMRQPLRLLRVLGPWRFFCFQATVGGTPFVLLLNPVYWLLGLCYAFSGTGLVPFFLPRLVFVTSVLSALVGNLALIYLSMHGLFKRERYGFIPLMFLSPIYWVLQSIAAWKGLYQLILKPHYWEKTTHNLTAGPDDRGRAV